jgi:hypothetical protein
MASTHHGHPQGSVHLGIQREPLAATGKLPKRRCLRSAHTRSKRKNFRMKHHAPNRSGCTSRNIEAMRRAWSGAGERLGRSCGCLFSISGKSLRGPRCSLALGQFLWVVVLSLGSSPTVFLPEWEAMELQLFPANNMDNMDFYNFYMRR